MKPLFRKAGEMSFVCYGNSLLKKLITAVILLSGACLYAQRAFITTWATGNSGTSGNKQITIPARGDYSYTWVSTDNPSLMGNGTASGEKTIAFPETGTYTLSITPAASQTPFNQIKFDFGGDAKKLLSIDQWGDIEWSSFVNAYTGTTNLRIKAVDTPDLSHVTDMTFAFFESGIEQVDNINSWDVSNVMVMEGVFYGTRNFNAYINDWDVSKVRVMKGMFANTKIYNQALDRWNVAGVTDTSFMFQDAKKFNQSLNTWNVGNLKNAAYMFSNTVKFNGDIGNWNTQSLENTEGMFTVALEFNKPLNDWDVSKVTNMSTMFAGALSFNQPLDKWNTERVTTIWGMFSSSGFNHPVGNWNIQGVTDMSNMFNSSAMDCLNYTKTLFRWAKSSNIPRGVVLGADGLTYSRDIMAERNVLTQDYGWSIEGDNIGDCAFLATTEVGLTDRLKYYPNPVTDILHLESEENIRQVKLYNAEGQSVSNAGGKAVKTVDMSRFKTGLYLLQVTFENGKQEAIKVTKK